MLKTHFVYGLCVKQAGIYWVTLIDQFLGTWVLLIVGLMEVVGVSYIYGIQLIHVI